MAEYNDLMQDTNFVLTAQPNYIEEVESEYSTEDEDE